MRILVSVMALAIALAWPSVGEAKSKKSTARSAATLQQKPATARENRSQTHARRKSNVQATSGGDASAGIPIRTFVPRLCGTTWNLRELSQTRRS